MTLNKGQEVALVSESFQGDLEIYPVEVTAENHWGLK